MSKIFTKTASNSLGSNTSPAYSFTNDPNTGMYSSATNTLDFSTDATNRLSISTTALTPTLPILNPDGDELNPSYSFSSSDSTGMSYSAPGILDFSVSGTNVASFDTSGPIFDKIRVGFGSSTQPSLTFSSDSDVGLYLVTGNTLGFTSGGAERMRMTDAVFSKTIPLRGEDGSISSPTYSFTNSTSTGMYSSGASVLNFATAGTNRLGISSTAITPTLPFTSQLGSASAPSYSFTGDPNTGMYSSTANTLNFTTDGTNRLGLSTTELLATNTSISYINNVSFNTGTKISLTSPGGQPGLIMYLDTDNNGTVDQRYDIFAEQETTARFYIKDNTADINFLLYDPGTDTLTLNIGMTILQNSYIGTTLPFLSQLGAVGAPTYSFTGDATTGMYSSGTSVLNFTTAGTNRLGISTTAITPTLPFTNQLGSASAPSYSFTGDPNTGMYSSTGDTLDFAAGGANKLKLSTTELLATDAQISYFNSTSFNTATKISLRSGGVIGDPSLVINIDTNNDGTVDQRYDIFGEESNSRFTIKDSTGSLNFLVYIPSTQNLRLGTGTELTISSTEITNTVPLIAPLGSASAPSYSFTGDVNTGIYSSTAETINFATAGINRLGISTTAITSTLPVVFPVGSYAAPSITFTGDTDLGLYRAVFDVTSSAIWSTGVLGIIGGATPTQTNIVENNMAYFGTGSNNSAGLFFRTATGTPEEYEISVHPTNYDFRIKLVDPSTEFIFYDISVPQLRLGPALELSIDSIGLTSTVPIVVPVGSVTAPSITFTGDTDLGLYRDTTTIWSSGFFGLKGGGAQTSITGNSTVYFGNGANNAASLLFTSDTHSYEINCHPSNDVFRMKNITDVDTFFSYNPNTPCITTTVPFQSALGAVGTPSYSFTGDANTGMYSSAADTLNFTTGGTSRLAISTTSLTTTVPIIQPSLTVSSGAATLTAVSYHVIGSGTATGATLPALSTMSSGQLFIISNTLTTPGTLTVTSNGAEIIGAASATTYAIPHLKSAQFIKISTNRWSVIQSV